MTFRLGFLRRCFEMFVAVDDVWFDAVIRPKADIVHVFQSPDPVPGAVNRVFHTHVIDLRLDEEELWQRVEKATRYEIRRAEKDGVVYRLCEMPSASTLQMVLADYEKLRARKGLEPLDRRRLRRLEEKNLLAVSCTADAAGCVLTWHIYVVTPQRARLLHSISNLALDSEASVRAVIGRANRFHHWQDILSFKRDGCEIYDLGGVYQGQTDSQKLQIAKFKRNFGGALENSYNATIALTPKGRMVGLLKRLVRS